MCIVFQYVVLILLGNFITTLISGAQHQHRCCLICGASKCICYCTNAAVEEKRIRRWRMVSMKVGGPFPAQRGCKGFSLVSWQDSKTQHTIFTLVALMHPTEFKRAPATCKNPRRTISTVGGCAPAHLSCCCVGKAHRGGNRLLWMPATFFQLYCHSVSLFTHHSPSSCYFTVQTPEHKHISVRISWLCVQCCLV